MIECSNYSWEKKLLYFAGLSIRASGWQNLLPIFHCYFSLEITPVYMQYSCAVTEWKNQNLMMYVFCSNTLIFAPECWKCILRDRFQNFSRNLHLRRSQVMPLLRVFSFSTCSKAFTSYLKSYWKPWLCVTVHLYDCCISLCCNMILS